uniref:Uncharacterized protein n=1 Tax=Latimeria chalumnae TaxID=7897 RepID=H3AV44_LATCH
MQRGTPQRKTVYRISLTLVKKELLGESSSDSSGSLEILKDRGNPSERSNLQRTCLVECNEERAEEEEEDHFASQSSFRTFRTFSTGHLDLGKLKISRKTHNFSKDLTFKLKEMGRADEKDDSNPRKKEGCSPRPASMVASLNVDLENRKNVWSWDEQARMSGEHRASSSSVNSSSSSKKRHPSLLRRSFSFRHWNGELMKIRALTREKLHNSSSCLNQIASRGEDDFHSPLPAGSEAAGSEKRNTLDVGEVLNKTDSFSDLGRWERSKGKNRTLDNSDLHKLSENLEKGKDGFFRGGLRTSGQERKLLRFFSGIFSKRDGTSTPVTSPNSKSQRDSLSRSRSESVNGSPVKG